MNYTYNIELRPEGCGQNNLEAPSLTTGANLSLALGAESHQISTEHHFILYYFPMFCRVWKPITAIISIMKMRVFFFFFLFFTPSVVLAQYNHC
jgi:hypothetical protein